MSRILSTIIEGKSPNRFELMLSILNALRELGNSGRNEEIEQKVIEINDIPDEELLIRMKGANSHTTVLHYHFGWAKYALKVMGLIDTPSRAVALLNKEGEKIQSIEQLRNIYNNLGKNNEDESEYIIDETQKLDLDYEDNSWINSLESKLRKMTSDSFEKFCIRILRELGYEVEVTSSKNDKGIDGFGHVKVGLLKFRVVIQCKNHNSAISRPEIDKFLGAMVINDYTRGIFITSSSFTNGAKNTAFQKNIDLIDFDGIVDILREKKIGIREQIILDDKFWEPY